MCRKFMLGENPFCASNADHPLALGASYESHKSYLYGGLEELPLEPRGKILYSIHNHKHLNI
jgi:hypothetical protein